MLSRSVMYVLAFLGTSFAVPFFYTELKLNSSVYTVSIDSTQDAFSSVDSFCSPEKYYYFNRPRYHLNYCNITIKKKNTCNNCSLFVYSLAPWEPIDTIPCAQLRTISQYWPQAFQDSAVINWGDAQPVAKKNSLAGAMQSFAIGDAHIRIALRKSNDSTSITLSKNTIHTAILNNAFQGKYSMPKTLKIKELSAAGQNFLLFDLSGKQVGSIINAHINYSKIKDMLPKILIFKSLDSQKGFNSGKIFLN